MDEELKELLPVIDTDNAKVVSTAIILLCFTIQFTIKVSGITCIWPPSYILCHISNQTSKKLQCFLKLLASMLWCSCLCQTDPSVKLDCFINYYLALLLVFHYNMNYMNNSSHTVYIYLNFFVRTFPSKQGRAGNTLYWDQGRIRTITKAIIR